MDFKQNDILIIKSFSGELLCKYLSHDSEVFMVQFLVGNKNNGNKHNPWSSYSSYSDGIITYTAKAFMGINSFVGTPSKIKTFDWIFETGELTNELMYSKKELFKKRKRIK